jgi:DNA-binding MarR family transcriptional regulator
MPLAHKKEREIVCRFLIDILRITHEAYAPAKEPFGSRIETFYIGFCVAIGHADGRPFSISKIANYMCIPRTTVMRRLKRLQEWKLIEKRGHQYLMCVPTFNSELGEHTYARTHKLLYDTIKKLSVLDTTLVDS